MSEQHRFTVTGMTCGHCEKAIVLAITQIDAQAHVQIEREQQLVTVISTQTREALKNAITEEGYAVIH